MILIVYYSIDINTYVGDEPTQQHEEMDELVEKPITHKLVMPQRSNIKFQTKLEDHICHMFTVKGVWLTHVREITHKLNMFDIWHKLLCDMRLVMGHVFGTLMFISRLQDDD